MKGEKATATHGAGYNCAQSVLRPFCEEHGIDPDTAFRLASVFGAGMGKMQLTCGTVTGAFMVIGLRHGFTSPNDPDQRAVVLSKAREFADAFRKEFGTLTCRELLGCDLNTEEGQQRHKEENQRELICARCVAFSARFLEQMEEPRFKTEP